jgi:hypothetical protein
MVDAASSLTIDGDLTSDVTVPGSRLRGSALDPSTRRPISEPATLFLTPEGGGRQSALGIQLDAGVFSTVGILPGRYAISARKASGSQLEVLDSAGRAATVEVREDVAEVRLELWAGR